VIRSSRGAVCGARTRIRRGTTLLCLSLSASCVYDLATPSRFLVDDTLADFQRGTLQDGGAKMYVSARGNVQLTDCLDVNGDGWADLPFSRGATGTDYRRPLFLYLGSAAKFVDQRRLELPAVGSVASAMADLDDDGFADLIITNQQDAATTQLRVRVHRGGSSGPSSNPSVELSTVGGTGLAIADLNRDGFLDLVVANNFDRRAQGNERWLLSYVYWGSTGGFREGDRTNLQTYGALDVAVADLDGDNYLDLVFANMEANDGNRKIKSYIYWGSPGGPGEMTDLATNGAAAVAIADLDRDGALDVVFANRGLDSDQTAKSMVYFGNRKSPRRYERMVELETRAAWGVAIADLDRDGHLDLVFPASAAQVGGTWMPQDSRIYWGPWTQGAADAAKKPTPVPTQSATNVLAADLDGDGHRDLVFALINDERSQIYWGPWSQAEGARGKVPTQLVVGGALSTVRAQPGAVSDRALEQAFVSRPLSAELEGPEWLTLAWQAKLRQGTLRFQLRSAPTEAGLKDARWLGPSSEADHYDRSPAEIERAHHRGHRFLQYRALLGSTSHASSPVLEAVRVGYR
jgi:hypothetical protein